MLLSEFWRYVNFWSLKMNILYMESEPHIHWNQLKSVDDSQTQTEWIHAHHNRDRNAANLVTVNNPGAERKPPLSQGTENQLPSTSPLLKKKKKSYQLPLPFQDLKKKKVTLYPLPFTRYRKPIYPLPPYSQYIQYSVTLFPLSFTRYGKKKNSYPLPSFLPKI